jgi:hypothetical protein
MATRRKAKKQEHVKPMAQWAEPVDDDAALGEELIRQARKGHAEFLAGWQKFMKELGIHGKPIGSKKLREMAIREGLDPESTEFSRGIIEMREE